MTVKLRALIIEDSEADAALLVRELEHSGYQVDYERVETGAAMKQQLLVHEWDIVLCDYSLPHFDAIRALGTLRESEVDIPFIVLSGTIEEESAVAVLKAGADDFIVKGRFARLAPAIERELEDAKIRRFYREGQARQEDLTDSLETVSAELERFLYTAFHELRSPLVTIKGFTGRLREDLKANDRDQTWNDIERISGAVDKMNDLLSDLLKLSRVGRVVRPSEDVELQQLAQNVVASLEGRIRSSRASIHIAPDLPVVYGDPSRLREVLENLIENATKHFDEQGQPRIEIGAEERDGQQVIYVRDNGRGIDPRYHNRVFNLFEKLDISTEGSGIGLAIVKRIIEFHGGRVWVESEGEGKGATFYFTLPSHRES